MQMQMPTTIYFSDCHYYCGVLSCLRSITVPNGQTVKLFLVREVFSRHSEINLEHKYSTVCTVQGMD